METESKLQHSTSTTPSPFDVATARELIGTFQLKQHRLSRSSANNLRPLFTDFPADVEVTRRTKGRDNYYFILNHASEGVLLKVGSGYFDLIESKDSPASFTLAPYGYKVLRKRDAASLRATP